MKNTVALKSNLELSNLAGCADEEFTDEDHILSERPISLCNSEESQWLRYKENVS